MDPGAYQSQWRERLLQSSLSASAGTIGVVLALIWFTTAANNHLALRPLGLLPVWTTALFHISMEGLLILAAVRKDWSSPLRASILAISIYLLAVFSLQTFGFTLGVGIGLLLVPLFGGHFFSRRVMWVAFFASALPFFVIPLILPEGSFITSALSDPSEPSNWYRVGLVFLTLGGLALYMVFWVLGQLEKTAAAKEEATAAFLREQEDRQRIERAMAKTNAAYLEELEYQAYCDALTDLPNRAGLHRKLKQLISTARDTGTKIGLILLDLDRFKEINVSLGHRVADQILSQIGPRISVVGRRDSSVYRLGGDEFGILVPGLVNGEEALAIAGDVLAALGRPMEVEGLSLEITASAGIALFPDDGGDSHELLRRSDVAMYNAKHLPRKVTSYHRSMDRDARDSISLTSDLRRAIRDGDLLLHYQPQVNLRDGSLRGFEALVRWPHRRLGLLPPSKFIPIAEEGELIHPLTHWVLKSALTQLASWQQRDTTFHMAVNLSVRNLLHWKWADQLQETLAELGVDPAHVELEITETALMTDRDMALENIRRISASGVQFALDDFGKGFSSLSYLRNFPIDSMKIDSSFVKDMTTEPQSMTIVRSTVELAHSLGLVVTAEGVEDERTAQALRHMGCDQAQGHYFSSPLHPDEIERRLAMGVGSEAWRPAARQVAS